MMTATAAATRPLRAAGLTVVTGVPKNDDMSNVWVISRDRQAVVVNVQVFSVIGYGCYKHPDYAATLADLKARVEKAWTDAGVEFAAGKSPDQYFLSGYKA